MARARKRSGNWQARWREAEGRERSKTLPGWSKAQVLAYAREQETDYRRNPWRAAQVVPTAEDYVHKTMVPRTGIEESTRYKERSGWKRIVDAFGPFKLNTITPSEVEAWVDDLATEGLKASTIRDLYGLLRQTFVTAMRDGIVDRTPCVGIGLPRRSNTATAASIEQVQAIAEHIDRRYKALVLFLAATGARIGESLGVTVADLVEVPHSAVVLRRGVAVDGNGRVIVKDRLKTERSVRTVTLPAWLWPELSHHIVEFDLKPGDYLFPAPNGGPMDPRRLRSRYWRPAAEAAGCTEVTPHTLRHLQASILVAEGRPRTEITARLGWSDPRVLDAVYSHFIAENDSAAANVIPDMRSQGGSAGS